jgi:hypothetical protein
MARRGPRPKPAGRQQHPVTCLCGNEAGPDGRCWTCHQCAAVGLAPGEVAEAEEELAYEQNLARKQRHIEAMGSRWPKWCEPQEYVEDLIQLWGVSDLREDERVYTVYFYYGLGDRLLYVGFTGRGHRRSQEHVRKAKWWPLVSRAEFEQFSSEWAALQAEKAFIAYCNPLFNVADNPRQKTPLGGGGLFDVADNPRQKTSPGGGGTLF